MADAVYTSGRWETKAGREQEFVDAWRELANWSSGNVRGSGTARLLQGIEDRTRFVGFWAFDDDDALGAWLGSPDVRRRLGALRDMVIDEEPGIFELRVEVPADVENTLQGGE